MARRRRRNVLGSEYSVARRAGLSDHDARALIAFRHGLDPAGDRPWTLAQVAALLFTRWRVERLPPEQADPVERKPKPKGRCVRVWCIGRPAHPAH